MADDLADLDVRFGLSVSAHRQQIGRSQRKFAEALTNAGMPVDASAVSRIEGGTRSVRLVEAYVIAQTLMCSMSDLCWQFDVAPEVAQTVPVLQQAIDELERVKRLMSGGEVKRPAPSGDKLLTMEEASALLRKSPAQLRWMRHNGTGPRSAKLGGRVMYREGDIQAYIAQVFE